MNALVIRYNGYMWRSWKFWAVAVPAALVLIVGGYIFQHSSIGIDLNNPPRFIQHDFIDLSQVYSISKFRSGAGHDFSGNGETCRSMKHYFTPQYDPAAKNRKVDGKELPPLPDGKTDISILSPVDGRIQTISDEQTPIGKQIGIIPDSQPKFLIRLFHVFPLDGIKAGTHLAAGQKIGVIGKDQGTDISIQGGALPWDENFISYFSVMPDSIFAAYTARGVASRDDLIITKAYRDAHPLQCLTDKTQAFVYPPDYDHNQDEVFLSGYVAPTFGGNTGGTGQSANQLLVSSSLNGQILTYKVGDQITLTTGASLSGLDLSGYDTAIIQQIGSTEHYQSQHTVKMLKSGQTPLVATLTPSCAIPKPNQPVCLIASQDITLTIVVQ